MEKKDLHNIIKNRLDNYESPVDLDLEWNAISKKQNSEKGVRKFLIWSSIFLVLLFSLGSIFYFNASDPLALEEKNTTSISEKITPNNNSTDTQISKETSSVSDFSNDNSQKEIVDKKVSLSNGNAFLEKNQLSKTEASQPLTTGKNQLSKTKDNQPLTTDKKQQSETEDNQPLKKINDEFNSDVNVPVDNISENKTQGNISQATNNMVEVEQEESMKNDAMEKQKNSNSFIAVAPIAQADIFLEEKLNTWTLDLEKTFVPSSFSRRSNFELFAGAGLFSSRQTFSAKNPAENDLAKTRKESETALETYSFDIGANYFINKRAFVQVGLNYSQWYDRLNHSYDRAKTYDFENVVVKRITYFPSGTVQEVVGDTSIVGSQTVKITQFNKYSSTNISAGFGYYFLQKNKWLMGLSGGVTYSMIGNSNGKILPVDGSGNLTTNDKYKNSFGLGLTSSLYLDYQLTNNFTVQLKPSVRYFTSSILKSESPLDAKLYQFGLTVGIKYGL